MKVGVSDQSGRRVVAVAGDVDLDTSPELWTQLDAALQGAPSVVVDLREVSYMDSSGVAILIQGLKHAQKTGTAYSLRDPSTPVMSVLELAQLPRLFEIERTEG